MWSGKCRSHKDRLAGNTVGHGGRTVLRLPHSHSQSIHWAVLRPLSCWRTLRNLATVTFDEEVLQVVINVFHSVHPLLTHNQPTSPTKLLNKLCNLVTYDEEPGHGERTTLRPPHSHSQLTHWVDPCPPSCLRTLRFQASQSPPLLFKNWKKNKQPLWKCLYSMTKNHDFCVSKSFLYATPPKILLQSSL